MNKQMTKILSLLLLAFILVGCGKEEKVEPIKTTELISYSFELNEDVLDYIFTYMSEVGDAETATTLKMDSVTSDIAIIKYLMITEDKDYTVTINQYQQLETGSSLFDVRYDSGQIYTYSMYHDTIPDLVPVKTITLDRNKL